MLTVLSLKGKSNRSDWWVTTISGSVIAQVSIATALIARLHESGPHWIGFIASIVVGVGALWATIAVTARRFRDRGDSPWMTLLLAVPVLGELWILVVCGFLPNPNQTRRKVVTRQVNNGSDTSPRVRGQR
jgi:uncharacterized membrane protein YhaH (DUF805 family)